MTSSYLDGLSPIRIDPMRRPNESLQPLNVEGLLKLALPIVPDTPRRHQVFSAGIISPPPITCIDETTFTQTVNDSAGMRRDYPHTPQVQRPNYEAYAHQTTRPFLGPVQTNNDRYSDLQNINYCVEQFQAGSQPISHQAYYIHPSVLTARQPAVYTHTPVLNSHSAPQSGFM